MTPPLSYTGSVCRFAAYLDLALPRAYSLGGPGQESATEGATAILQDHNGLCEDKLGPGGSKNCAVEGLECVCISLLGTEEGAGFIDDGRVCEPEEAGPWQD